MAVGHARPREAYACDPDHSRGRLVAEPQSATRSAFRRDCDRIIHSTAFRRLKHKTQVFIFHEGDHYRTRLTHSLEVAQIGRSLARALGIDEDLTEGLALAHDLGHPPFGHAGERALDACMKNFGGFDHNAQALAIVTRLERRYPDFDGLNLTWESLEGIVKHNGPLIRAGDDADLAGLSAIIRDYNARHDLQLASHAGLEAQAAAIADDIAYNAHDIDDGLRAGLFNLDDLKPLPLAGDILRDIATLFPGLDEVRTGAQLVRLLITALIEDVLNEAACRIAALNPSDADAVRTHSAPLVSFSADVAASVKAIKAFLFGRMYRHARVMRVMGEAEAILRDLFEAYSRDPSYLPEDWRPVALLDEAGHVALVSDFIAGMTDRFALDEHRRLFDSTPKLR